MWMYYMNIMIYPGSRGTCRSIGVCGCTSSRQNTGIATRYRLQSPIGVYYIMIYPGIRDTCRSIGVCGCTSRRQNTGIATHYRLNKVKMWMYNIMIYPDSLDTCRSIGVCGCTSSRQNTGIATRYRLNKSQNVNVLHVHNDLSGQSRYMSQYWSLWMHVFPSKHWNCDSLQAE